MITDLLERFDEYLEEHPALENRLEHGTLMAAACLPVYAYAGYATLDSFGLPKRFGRIGAWSIGLSILSGALWSCLPQAKEKPGAHVEKEVMRQYAKYRGSVMDEISLSLQEYQVNKIYENRMEDIERESDFTMEGFQTLSSGQRVPIFTRTRPGDYDWHPGHAKVDSRIMRDYIRSAADWDNWEDIVDEEFSEDLEGIDDLDYDDLYPDYLHRGYQPRNNNNRGDRYYYERDEGERGNLVKLKWAERGFTDAISRNRDRDSGGSRSVVNDILESRKRSQSSSSDAAMDVILKHTEAGRRAAAERDARLRSEGITDDDMKFGKPKESSAEPERVAPNSSRGLLQRQFKAMLEESEAKAKAKQTQGGTLIKGAVNVSSDPRDTAAPTHRVNTPAAVRNISPSIAGEVDPDFVPEAPQAKRVQTIEELMMDDDEDDDEYPIGESAVFSNPIMPEDEDSLFNEIPVIKGAVHARGPVSEEDPH